MSASLVGSEMCIRDSLLHRTCAEGIRALAGGLSKCPRRQAPDAWRRRGPVSYTHLTLPTICSV
eukprot:10334695-Alexandrium_andersonii.AAC.1